MAEIKPAASVARPSRERSRRCVCIVLAGGLRPSPLSHEIGRSVLDLPVAPGRTLLEHWLSLLDVVADGLALDMEVRVVGSHSVPFPVTRPRSSELPVAVLCDRGEFRGPGGSALDACLHDPDDTLVIIVEAARLVTCTLAPIIAEHVELSSGVTIACNEDSSTTGITVSTRAHLGLMPLRGYHDLKEQWLSMVMRRGLRVSVHRLKGCPVRSLRTREQYLAAVNALNNGRPLVEPDVQIASTARVIDSVILSGARIDEGAIIARSIIGECNQIGRNALMIDDVLPCQRNPDEHAPMMWTVGDIHALALQRMTGR